MAVYLPSQDKDFWRTLALLTIREHFGDDAASAFVRDCRERDENERLERMMRAPVRPAWWRRLLGLPASPAPTDRTT